MMVTSALVVMKAPMTVMKMMAVITKVDDSVYEDDGGARVSSPPRLSMSFSCRRPTTSSSPSSISSVSGLRQDPVAPRRAFWYLSWPSSTLAVENKKCIS